MEEKRQVPWEKAESFAQQEGLPLGTQKMVDGRKTSEKDGDMSPSFQGFASIKVDLRSNDGTSREIFDDF